MASVAPIGAGEAAAPTEGVPALQAALAAARAEIERLTNEDPLTGCLSRAGLAPALRGLPPGVVLVLDCDDLTAVNDTLGYATGDGVLRALADRVRGALRPDDALARVEGARFLAILPGADTAEARVVAERVRISVATDAFLGEPAPLHLTVSIGLAPLPRDPVAVEELLSTAHIALRTREGRGRNGVSVPQGSVTAPPSPPALRPFIEALRAGEGLAMHAQAIHALPDEQVAGWEMLLRGPPGPLESPVALFRLAEQHHFATALDLSCVGLAVAAARRGGLQGIVHVNLLPTTLLAVEPERLLTLLGPPPARARWCVELSERHFLGDAEQLVSRVDHLRRGGMMIAVDDVGSRRGTLDGVAVLQPHIAKLDIRLVRGLATDPWRQRFVRRLVRMMEALGTEIVAEGIEDRADLAVLVDVGVGLGQGWLWGRAEAPQAQSAM